MNCAILSLAFLSAGLLSGQSEQPYGPPPPPPPPPVPQLYCAEPAYDWGTVYSGEAVEHPFVIQNKGSKVLKIQSVKATCGCTTTRYDKEIPPGGKGEVVMKVNTRGFTHRIQKYITINSNDSKKPSFRLSMKGEVKPLVTFEPRYPKLEGLRGKILTTTVRLKGQVDKPLAIAGVKPVGTIKPTYKLKEVTPGKEYDLTLSIDTSTVKSTYYYGQPVSMQVQVKLEGKTLQVPLRAQLKLVNTVNASKRYLYFSRTLVQRFLEGKAEPPSQTITLSGHEGRQFSVTGVEIRARKLGSLKETIVLEDPPIEVAVNPKEKAASHTVTVTLRKIPQEKQKTTSCEIHIRTDDPDTKEVVVRATVYFPRPGSRLSTRPSVRFPYGLPTTRSRVPIRPSTKKRTTVKKPSPSKQK